MHHLDLILTLSGGLCAALLFGILMHRVGLSPIVGYLLAGIVISPRTPGFVANEALANELAEIGVILLMFGVGLQFHFRELLAVRRIALPGAAVQIAVATLLGALACRLWGYTWSAGLVFGVAISVASTVVLVRVLADHGDLHTASGKTAVGWLVVEDLFTVLVLVALPLLFGQSDASDSRSLWVTLLVASLKLAVFVAVMFVAGRRLIPRLFRYVAATRSRELFTLTVLVSALGIAVGSAQLFGASMALGAFLAGLIVGQSPFSARAASDALPMRDAFAVLFFVSVGMLFDPRHVLVAPGQVLITLLIVLVGKPLAAWLIVRMLKGPVPLAASVSVVLAQIGEFSFLVGSSAQVLGILPSEAASTLVAVSIASITLNPVFYRLARAWARRAPKASQAVIDDEQAAHDEEGGRERAIVVGHGPTGQIVVEILDKNGIEPVIIDLNIRTVESLLARGVKAVYGDATRPEVLTQAGLPGATALFLTSAALEGAVDVIRLAKELNPNIRIYARTAYLHEVRALDAAGAVDVVAAEGEVAVVMAMSLLRALGASPEQIDRERDRVSRMLRERWSASSESKVVHPSHA